MDTYYDKTCRLWTEESIQAGTKELRSMTPAQLITACSPDVAIYIQELRFEVEFWKNLFNQELEK